MKNQTLIVRLGIPILPVTSHIKFDITTVPFKNNNSTKLISLEKDLLIADNQNRSLKWVRAEKLNKCIQSSKDFLLCPIIYKTMNTAADDCIKSHFFGNTTITACMIRQIPTQNYAIQLTHNSFYLFINSSINVNIQCENGTNLFTTIDKTVLITIDEQCYLTDEIENNLLDMKHMHALTPFIHLNVPYEFVHNSYPNASPVFLIERYQMQQNDIFKKINKLSDQSNKKLHRIIATPWYWTALKYALPLFSILTVTCCLYKHCSLVTGTRN